ncbi:MAG: glutamate--tRNA ligase [Acetobacteraceae bacterium]
MNVRTRFAPSPTGTLHIGAARTALFNFLFSRHHGGTYLLRIEDTDRARNTEAAVHAILDGLAWLDLASDEPAVFQSRRLARHAEVARAMVAAGRAYFCYCSPEELAAMRARALAEGRPPRYDGRWRDRDRREAPAGVAPAIRIKAPREGETVIEDLVQGTVRVANAELDDMIILRGDGTPTYQHAVVVDDHDMGITHVIRGDDHLTNAFRQTQIYRTMGWEPPAFAHIPLIHGADGAKLSKRHGAQSVVEFRDLGFLPEALCNYLLRLGWGHGDAEVLSREEAIRLFDLDGVGRAPSRMDYAKLTHLNGVWLRHADDVRLVDDVMARLRHDGAVVEEAAERVRALMPVLKERARTLAELADNAAFLARPLPLEMQPKARAVLSVSARGGLADLVPVLETCAFTPTALDVALREFTAGRGEKLGAIAQPLRAALTGAAASPPIDAVLIALGRAEVLARVRAVLAFV